jgi:hypothetical protein
MEIDRGEPRLQIGTGFFSIDCGAFRCAAIGGLNSAIAHLILARSTGPDNVTTQWASTQSRNAQASPYSTLVETLNRHRGKGQQKMTIEHVHVYEGGQAIVGNVESRGEGSHRNQRNNPMHLDMHRPLRCRARTRRGSLCQSPAMKNGRCRMHGGMSPGAPRGNKNALKHGRYAAETIALRREVAELIRIAGKLMG